MTADTGHAWYVYSVLPAAAGLPTPELAAPALAVLPGARVEPLPLGALTVLASLVPRALFDRDHAANRTADPDWMAERLAAHHAVNVAASAAGACLPLAFGALFSTLGRLQDWLAPREAALAQALAGVAGQSEWALAVQEDAAALADWLDGHDPAVQRLRRAAAGAGEGTAFLLRRQLHSARANARAGQCATVAAVLGAQLAAAGLRPLAEPPRGGLPGWTLLERAGAAARLHALLDPLAAALPRGLSLRLTGPWPAYAFARAALARESVDA